MLEIKGAFSSFAVRDIEEARKFYRESLGLIAWFRDPAGNILSIVEPRR